MRDREIPSPPSADSGEKVAEGRMRGRTRAKIIFARRLRRDPTKAERKVWTWLRNRRFRFAKFRRQHVIGPFVLDFYSAELRLAIEIDGSSHHDDEQRLDDRRREAYLNARRIAIVRVTNDLVLKEPDAAGDQIGAAIDLRRR